MAAVGTARLPDPAADSKTIHRGILNGLLHTRAADLPVPDAALLRAATGKIIKAAIDTGILSQDHVGVVLRRFTPAIRRWRYDDPAKIKDAVRWPVNSEREVQDITWMLLRSAFDDVVELSRPAEPLWGGTRRRQPGACRCGLRVIAAIDRDRSPIKMTG